VFKRYWNWAKKNRWRMFASYLSIAIIAGWVSFSRYPKSPLNALIDLLVAIVALSLSFSLF